MKKLIWLPLLLLLFSIRVGADDLETINIQNVQIGSDVLNFTVEVDATTGKVVSFPSDYSMPLSYSGPPTTLSFSITYAQLPYYWWTYGQGQPFEMTWFDNLNLTGSAIWFDAAGLSDTAPGSYPVTMVTSFSSTGVNGIPSGYSTATGGTITVTDPNSLPATSNTSSVPEPPTGILLVSALVAFKGYRRSKENRRP
jgi:hypothetical protein